MSPKVIQNGLQNELQKVSQIENAKCEKTYYLVRFSYILPLQRPPEVCTISYKMRPPTPCTYFDSQK